MILVLAGSTEGREISSRLRKENIPCLLSYASDYGAELYSDLGDEAYLSGEMDETSLERVIRENGIKLIIDATHPFAVKISKLAIDISKKLGIRYLRFERKKSLIKEDYKLKVIKSLDEVDEFLYSGIRVLSTMGSKNLAELLPLLNKYSLKLFLRIIPNSQIIKRCEELKLKANQIIAMQGPFSQEYNQILLKDLKIDLLLSKDSGYEGGLYSKIRAAQELNIMHLILSRPQETFKDSLIFHDYDALIYSLK